MTGAALLGAVALSGCTKTEVLTADTPDVITPDNLGTPEGLQALYTGAVSDLVVASSGASGVIIFSGLFTDELMHASTPPAVREWDLRAVLATNSVATLGPNPATGTTGGPFIGLQIARTALEAAARRLPDNDARTGELWALAGMSYVMFGELWCSGTPFSERDPAVELGTPLSTDEMFARALDRLNTAGSNTGGDGRIQNLVAVLKGRALLDQGQFAAAATAVAGVPTDYEYDFFHGAPPARQTNQIQLQNRERHLLGVRS